MYFSRAFIRGAMNLTRLFSTSKWLQKFNEPLSGHEMIRAGGLASMMRLPVQSTAKGTSGVKNAERKQTFHGEMSFCFLIGGHGLDACFVGVPLDIGTSNRSGARFGPRQIRTESCMIRKNNIATGACPFESIQVADVGDINLNTYNLPKAVEDIRKGILMILRHNCKPLVLGGDHTMTYPILQAIKEKHGSVGLVHVDAHADCHDEMLGEKIAHGTPFRRAFEEGCLDSARVIQIGLRGSCYSLQDYDWGKKQGFRIVPVEECWHKSLTPLMEEVRAMMGDKPVYISFDIDALDPAYAPGTGTPEIGGLTTIQGLEIIRGCRGLNVVGGDLVEVSPPYDPTGTTALTAANLLFEMICVLPGVKYNI